MEVKTKYGPFELDETRLFSAMEREFSRALVPVIEEAIKIQTDQVMIFFYKGKTPSIHVSWSDEEFKDVTLLKIIKEQVSDEAEYPQEDQEWRETANELRKIADYIDAKVKRS